MRNKDPRGAGRGHPPGRGGPSKAGQAPSQRQLRAGELIRHALAEVLRETDIQDPAVAGVSVTVSEVRMSPDLRHATCFVQPLGGEKADDVVSGLNRAAKFLRGRLGPHLDLKFTPDLNFRHDESFDTAAHMDELFAKPEVQRDLTQTSPAERGRGTAEGGGGGEPQASGDPSSTPSAAPPPPPQAGEDED